jgi:hypothetical protein
MRTLVPAKPQPKPAPAPVQRRTAPALAPEPVPDEALPDPAQLAAPGRGHKLASVSIMPPGHMGDVPAPQIQAAAQAGLRTPGGSLPYAPQIQAAFGRHDISGVQAHTDPAAQAAAAAANAVAFATGEHVVFGAPPDLRTAAHEAAHVVQQRAGVQVAGGIGQVGDAYEQEADAIASRVTAGQSAEALLDRGARQGGAEVPNAGAGQAVQRIVWQVNGPDEFIPLFDEEDADEPQGQVLERLQALNIGQIYDDVTDQVYPGLLAYIESELQDEDDAADLDFDEPLEPDGDSDEEAEEGMVLESDAEGQASVDEEPAAPAPGVAAAAASDPEEFRKLIQQSRQAPLLTSQLTPNQSPQPAPLQVFDKLKRKGQNTFEQRQAASGPVRITLEAIEYRGKPYSRPVQIEGYIEPTVTTGRLGAPDPNAGFQVYMPRSEGARTPALSIPHERNTGRPDVERGHIMALELGGPDIPQNIVPQWAKFQGSGDWRKVEVLALAKAEEAAKKSILLNYKVQVFYKQYRDNQSASYIGATFPTGFRVTIQEFDAKHQALGDEQVLFDQGQAQNITDESLAMRQFVQTDEVEEGDYPDFDFGSGKLIGAEDEEGGTKKKRPRKRADVKQKKGVTKVRKDKGKAASQKKKQAIVTKKRGQAGDD